jgi:PAS domain S-box-containing protein
LRVLAPLPLPSAGQPALDLLAVFNSLPGAYLLLSPELVIEAASDAYVAATLTRRESIVGRPVFEVFPDNPATVHTGAVRNLQASLLQVLATRQPHTMAQQQYDVPDPNHPGHFVERYWQPTNTPVLDTQGRLRYLLHQVVNVTDHVQAARQLQESQAREQVAQQRLERSQQEWRTLTDAIKHLVWTLDSAGEADYFNAQWYAYTGSSWATSQGQLWWQAVQADDLLVLAPRWAAAQQQGTSYQVEARLRQASGSYRWFLLRFQPLSEGQEVRWFATATDIHEHKHHEQELARVSQLLRATLDSSADMVQVFTAVRAADGHIVDFEWTLVNAVATRYYGQPVIGLRLRAHNPGVAETGILDRFIEVVETGEPQRYEQEYRFEQFNGWFEQSAVRLGDGLVTTTVDITARKQAEQQFQASHEQLRRTNVDLDNFIYTASHDLKAPISNIEGLLLALEHELPPAGRVGEVPTMLTMMQEAVERFQRTIQHLTDVSRLQQEHSQALEQLLLAPVVAEVLLDLRPLIQQTQARVDVSIPAELTVKFSAKNLRSVVYNLVSNALKYRQADQLPRVQVSCGLEDSYQVLRVQDNGLGLDLTRGSGKLFGMFQRLHTHVEGTGIGLYMVKKMVENAGGRIEVESRPNQGATFRVYFLR